MSHTTRRTFADILRESAPQAARILFEKARQASEIAKCGVSVRSRRAAYVAKERHLDRLTQVVPDRRRLRRFKDYDCGRWVLRFGFEAIHWRRLDEPDPVLHRRDASCQAAFAPTASL